MAKLKKRMFIKKILSFVVSLILLINQPILGYQTVLADGAITDYNPALIPIFTTVASVAVGLGIVGQNAGNAVNQLVNNAISQIKSNELARKQADETYKSPYVVVDNNGNMEEPNNNNKNGKWFAIAAASALGAAVVGEKGMVEDIADTLNGLGAFNELMGSVGVVSADNLKTQGTASQIALQMANINNACVGQWDAFLHSSFWDNKEFTYNDCTFFVNVEVMYALPPYNQYPKMYIRVFPDLTDVEYVNVASVFGKYTYTNSDTSIDYLYVTNGSIAISFLNNDSVSINVPYYGLQVSRRDANTGIVVSQINNGTTSSTSISPISVSSSSYNKYAYMGYKWENMQQWGFTNNVYNAGDTIINQYPNWDSEQLTLLGQQIDSLRIGIQSLNSPWDATQVDIQSATSPENVIAQLLNNYLNPENAPDPYPDPDPDPDPEPAPEPAPEPIPDNTYLGEFLLPDSITTKFPFSIPFDIARCLRLFSTNSRTAPRWETDLHYGNNTSHVVIDLSVFDDVAALIRPIEFIAFLIGLAYATRYLIKG